jgi:methionine synthase II (cobalamin-independent)
VATQAAEKPLQAVIPSPFAVILSGAKDLRISLRVNSARNLALSIVNAVRDSSSSANKNGGLLGMTGQTGFSATCTAASKSRTC